MHLFQARFARMQARFARMQACFARMSVFVAASATLAACAAPGDSSPVHKMAEYAGIATKAPEAQPFVTQSRPAKTDYLPVGITPPARPLKARTPEEVKKLQDELEATRKANEAKASAKP